jgi:hypothetical protein
MKGKYKNIIIGGLISLAIGVSSQFIKHGYISKAKASFQDQSIPYSNSDFGFSITFPNEPTIGLNVVKIDSTRSVALTSISSIGADKSEYAIIVAEYPEGLLNGNLPYETLHRGVDAAMKDSNFEIIYTTDTLLDNIPAVYVKSQNLSDAKYYRYMMATLNGDKPISLLGDLHYHPTHLSHFNNYFSTFHMFQE